MESRRVTNPHNIDLQGGYHWKTEYLARMRELQAAHDLGWDGMLSGSEKEQRDQARDLLAEYRWLLYAHTNHLLGLK